MSKETVTKVTTHSEKLGEAAWGRFLKEIHIARGKIDCEEVVPKGEFAVEPWFRGHSTSSYQLIPSLHRRMSQKLGKKCNANEIRKKEMELFREFASRAKEIHGILNDDWDILFAMQHYGVPTRLLDWTESLAVAVYFAVLGVREPKKGEQFVDDSRQQTDGEWSIKPPSVWVLNPFKLNDCSDWLAKRDKAIKSDDGRVLRPHELGYNAKTKRFEGYDDMLVKGKMNWKHPAAIWPTQRNPRLHGQRAWFTVQGNSLLPLNQNRDDVVTDYVQEVKLPFCAVSEAKRFLRLAGIDHYLMFSDLPSLALQISLKRGLIGQLEAETKMLARM